MVIKDKLSGFYKRRELNLNHFPEEIFNKSQKDELRYFIDKHTAEYFAIRSIDVIDYKSKINKIKVLRNDVDCEIENHNTYSISVSSHNYIENLILTGDIRIGINNEVWLLASRKEYPKVSSSPPEYNLSTDIFDKKLNEVPAFDVIFKYIVDNGLIDVIVEFAIYDKNVGINNEQVVVFEIRTDF